jgi:hypothetical protein
MNEAMNTRKTSSGIVFSVFAEKESNASAALRRGIGTSQVGQVFPKSLYVASVRVAEFYR